MFNLSRALIILALSVVPIVKAQSAVLVVGENCVEYERKNQLASLAFDADSRRLLVHTLNLSDEYDSSTFMSEPITIPPKFNDRDNPLHIMKLGSKIVGGVVFSTKNSISISFSSNGVRQNFHCQAYYPWQLGMIY